MRSELAGLIPLPRFCTCAFPLSQREELNFPSCLLLTFYHIWQFGWDVVVFFFFMTLRSDFRSVLCAWRPLASLKIS